MDVGRKTLERAATRVELDHSQPFEIPVIFVRRLAVEDQPLKFLMGGTKKRVVPPAMDSSST
jgi:hypothetical protein